MSLTRDPITEMETARLKEALISDLNSNQYYVDRLTGRSGGLRPSKPTAKHDTGLVQYLWRMARFHAGHDTSMPVTASFDLTRWVEDVLEREVSCTDAVIRRIEKELESVIDVVLVKLGEDPTKAARRWKGLLY